ncbi:Programmed cell death protein 2 [Quillaja saponaria]|uniref:Programmed cell death protein 2 n=1 Tax=Quillaja saponaria TaxID=32244 RepID=A0AAD7M356_QUISA|nr:Programmed cell death protein 2 [Quillaja saponaria]
MNIGAEEVPVNKFKGVRITSLDDEDDDEGQEIVDDEVEDDDDDEEQSEPITIGFVEKPENQWSLLRQYFPSKAGGVPAWLDPVNLPSGRSCACDICGESLQFLLQVYAPMEKESAFHRMLFVFMCPSMRCLLRDQHEQWKRHPEKASRRSSACQLPRVNPFYSSEDPACNGTQEPSVAGAALCDWCGTWKGDKLCSSCRRVRYCSKKHQLIHWRSGHNIACQKLRDSSQAAECSPNYNGVTSAEFQKVASKTVWPEFEIVTEDESESCTDMSDANVCANSLITRDNIDDTRNLLLENFQGDDDKKSWANFQERIAKAPEQVLRYYRNTRVRPLWPMSSGRPSNVDIPKCSFCGGPLCCEFQILPQLLYYFGVENDVDSLDWVTIVVYACEASCEAGAAYTQEYAWVQLLPSTT